MKHFTLMLTLGLVLCGCAGEPPGAPELAHQAADRYLSAWQEGDWNRIYEFEGRLPDVPPILHRALTDNLEFYSINEVRYSDSAAACAVTLRWIAPEAEYTETGELYLERVGIDWRVTGFRSF